jgi:hypothetical protein
MGGSIHWFVDIRVSSDEAEQVACRALTWLTERKIVQGFCGDNGLYRPGASASGDWLDTDSYGLQLVRQRTVFHAGDSGLDGFICPHCRQESSIDVIDWDAAVGDWFEGNDAAAMQCPGCKTSSLLNDWQFLPMAWAFGNLGLGFCDWCLEEDMVQALIDFLGGDLRQVHEHI